MPAARESLLDAASAALASQPWAVVRMVDVAAAAGVSRQTLYNEFGSKDGIAKALVRREAEGFLSGIERALNAAERHGADAGDCVAAAAGWTLHTARRNPLIRAALTGHRGEWLPAQAVTAPTPLQRQVPPRSRGDGSPPTPSDLVSAIRARVAAALERGYPEVDHADIGWVCEVAVRLTLSYLVAPASSDEDACPQVARLVRALLLSRR